MALRTDAEIETISPVEVMLDAMRVHYKAAQRELVMKPSVGRGLMRRAAVIAATVAPYCHVKAAHEDGDGKRVLEILIEDVASDDAPRRITART